MAPESKIKSVKLLRANVKGQLTKILNVSNVANPDPDEIDVYRARLDRARTLFNDFESYEKELFELDPDNSASQIDEVFETFVQIEARLKKAIRKSSPQDVSTADFNNTTMNTTYRSEAKLPKLVIPKYTGDPMQWQSFFDLFTRSVHENQSISSAQKMGHLLTLLAPEAEKVVHHLPISDANYGEALILLKNRFDKKN